MKPKAPPPVSEKKDTVVSLIPHTGPQVFMVEAQQDSKLKRTKVCACASVLIALIIVAGVLGSIALWKVRFPYQNEHIHRPYKPNSHNYPPPQNTGPNKYPGHGWGTKSPVNPGQKEDISENDVPDILRASTTVLPSNGPHDDTISIDGPEKDRVDTVRPTTPFETLTVSVTRTDDDSDEDRTSIEGGNKPTSEGAIPEEDDDDDESESFGSFDHSFNYEWTSYDGSSSSASSVEYQVYQSFDQNGEISHESKLIPLTPDYESESYDDDEDDHTGSGFGDHGSGFGDMEGSGDQEGSGDYSSIIDPDMYLPLPEISFGTHQFPMLDQNDYSSSVTEISNVLKDPKQEYEFWKYIYDQSDVLVNYIEGAKQKLIRQEISLNIVDPDLPSVQLVRTPGPEDNFKGKCYNLVCSMKTQPDGDKMRWTLTGYAREGVRLVHASGNKGEVQITLRRQPISATSMLHYNSYLLLQFSDLCFIAQVESGLPQTLPKRRSDVPIVETFQSTAKIYASSGSEFCEGLPVYWARKVDGVQLMDTFGRVNATPGSSLARRKDIQMPCCHCKDEPCICSCDML
ncbi:uncharacterized protein [Amphiura filiformis]|uniref:uncharacterized protein n=1 Tax=Amphiura filiformis TaxID=82378 RepID=UPI003B211C49